MAERNINMSKLVLRLDDGLDKNNKQKHKDVTYTRIAEAASDDAVKACGQALASLQDKELLHVVRVDEVILG